MLDHNSVQKSWLAMLDHNSVQKSWPAMLDYNSVQKNIIVAVFRKWWVFFLKHLLFHLHKSIVYPKNLPRGTYVGLLHRLYRICTNPLFLSVFVQACCPIILFLFSKLVRLFSQFLRNRLPLRWSRLRSLRKTNVLVSQLSSTAKTLAESGN